MEGPDIKKGGYRVTDYWREEMPKFCWFCGNKFWGNKIYYMLGGYGNECFPLKTYCHKSCAEKEGYIPMAVKR
jgi:hypothetical protein